MAGLLPDNLPSFLNGRHRGQEFWLNDQDQDYYRRHLVIHEATHCYMTIIAEELDVPWDSIRTVFADMNRHVNNGEEYIVTTTHGSQLVRLQHPHLVHAVIQ